MNPISWMKRLRQNPKPAALVCAAVLLTGAAWAAAAPENSERAATAAQPSAAAQQLVARVVQNELTAGKNDRTRWYYQSREETPGQQELKEVVETSKGNLDLLLEKDGQPVSKQELQQEQQKLRQMAQDPNALAGRQKASRSDDEKAERLMQMLPQAFLYTDEGATSEGNEKLSFKPNPNFDPPTREAKVFHSMVGEMVVDPKEDRLVSLSGTLNRDVTFGWGIFGRLRKGGTFAVRRVEVAPRMWKTWLTEVHISGHALFFKTISEQQHEVHSGFRQVPSNITPTQAAQMLVERADPVSLAEKR